MKLKSVEEVVIIDIEEIRLFILQCFFRISSKYSSYDESEYTKKFKERNLDIYFSDFLVIIDARIHLELIWLSRYLNFWFQVLTRY